MRALLVYNPNATTTTAALTELLADVLSVELKLDVATTQRRGHAASLAAQAAGDGHEAVFVLGGDGTVNEAIQGLARTPVKLAVLPGGSTNVFARTLGIPLDPVEAAAVALQRLRDHADRRVNLGTANGRYFAFCAGWGYDARVVRMVEERERMKQWGRQATFLWCGLLATASHPRAGQADVTLQPDRGPATAGLRSLICCNSNPYTFLGPMPAQMCPGADLDLGLDVTALTRTSLWDLVRTMRAALSGRAVPTLRHVRSWHDQPGYLAVSARPLPLHVDGEPVGESRALDLRSARSALTVVA